MRWLPIALLPLIACSPSRQLTPAQNPYRLPVTNGQVTYRQTVVKKAVRLEDFFRTARAWICDHTADYSLEWEQPVFKKTLLHSAVIPPSRLETNYTDYYTRRSVVYYITVDAENDSCKVMLSNFMVSGIRKSDVDLDKVLMDSSLCVSVDRECRQVVESLSEYIRKHSERPL